MDPFILAICPTYKRPACLANVAACYLRQTYPRERRRLLICDDAKQFEPHAATVDAPWDLFVPPARFATLPDKFNAMVRHALEGLRLEPDLIAIFEDDDVYLPWHLSAIAEAFRGGAEMIVPKRIWSTSKDAPEGFRQEPASRRFHASWAFSARLFAKAGGYPDTDRLDFDQQMRSRLVRAAPQTPGAVVELEHEKPSYVYRWPGMPYHGSQVREVKFAQFWKSLEARPSPWVGALVPRLDDETKRLFEKIAGVVI